MQVKYREATPPNEQLVVRSNVVNIKANAEQIGGGKPAVQVNITLHQVCFPLPCTAKILRSCTLFGSHMSCQHHAGRSHLTQAAVGDTFTGTCTGRGGGRREAAGYGHRSFQEVGGPARTVGESSCSSIDRCEGFMRGLKGSQSEDGVSGECERGEE